MRNTAPPTRLEHNSCSSSVPPVAYFESLASLFPHSTAPPLPLIGREPRHFRRRHACSCAWVLLGGCWAGAACGVGVGALSVDLSVDFPVGAQVVAGHETGDMHIAVYDFNPASQTLWFSVGRINEAMDFGPDGSAWKACYRPFLEYPLAGLWAGAPPA